MKERQQEARYTDLLKNKNYVLYWLASALSQGSSNILQFVLSLYVLDITGSASIFASILSIIIIPRFLLTPYAGVLGDRFSRIRWMATLNFASALLTLVFLLIHGIEDLALTHIYILVIGLEIVEIFYSPASFGIIASLVEDHELALGVAASKIDDGIVNVMAPVVASFLYVSFGIDGGMIPAITLFVGSGLMMYFITGRAAQKPKQTAKKKTVCEDMKYSLQVVARHEHLWKLVAIIGIFNFFVSFYVNIIYTLTKVIHVSDYVFGIYKTANASMFVITPFIAMPIVKRVNPLTIKKVSWGIIPTCLMGMSMVTYLTMKGAISDMGGTIGLVILGCISAGTAVTMNMGLSIMFQKIVPENFRSRFGAVFVMMGTVSIPLGHMVFGLITDWAGPSISFLINALGCYFGLFLSLRAFRGIQTLDQMKVQLDEEDLHVIERMSKEENM
ncbi:MAG: MFS transporter [Tissierellia bacterium]|nr:MFS transporter [Tissierellia bacterium]